MKMTDDFTPAESGAGRSMRVPVSLECEVRQGTRPWKKVLLHDISQSGFGMAMARDISLQRSLRIRIPGLAMLTANIRYHTRDRLGCEFEHPLHVAVFDHIVRQAKGG